MSSNFAQSHEGMAFLNRIFHGHDYDQTPPVHIIYPSREAYQIPIDYTGTGSSQWGHPQQQQQQSWQGFPMGQQQQMGGMQPMQQQDGRMMQQGGFPGLQQQMGFGGPQHMQPGMIQQGGFHGHQQMGFGAGPMMGGGQHQQQNHPGGCPVHHKGMPGGMAGEPHRMVIPGQHGVLVIEGPPQGFQYGGPQHIGGLPRQPGAF